MTRFDIVLFVAGALLLLLGIACALLATNREDRMLASTDTPTSPIADLPAIARAQGALGQRCEITGVLEADNYSLTSPISGQLCAAFTLTTAWEEWGPPRFVDVKKSRDMNGQVCRDTGTNFDDQRVPSFWVRDASGRVQVEPPNATLDMAQTERRYEVMTASFGDSERRSWRTEHSLPLGQQVYVLGYLGERNGEPVLRCHPRDGKQPFLISHRSERQLVSANRWAAYGYYFAAGISGSLGLVLIAWRVLLLRGMI